MSYDVCTVHLFVCISVCAGGHLGSGTDVCNHGCVCAQGYMVVNTCVQVSCMCVCSDNSSPLRAC